jgi:hypothetical protein
LNDITEQIATAMRDAETPVAARGGQDAGGQSLFDLSCDACYPVKSRLPFSFICAGAPELTPKLVRYSQSFGKIRKYKKSISIQKQKINKESKKKKRFRSKR